MADVAELSVEDFSDYLKQNKFPGEVLDSFIQNEISGSIFLLMEEEELKELEPIIHKHQSLQKKTLA